jgi:hypothetical protein
VIRDDDDADETTPSPDDAPQSSSRKERVIHARIPAALDDALKSFASSMRVPVSNLVRAVLEDAVAVTQKASDKVVEAAESVADKAAARSRVRTTAPSTDVVARDPLVGVFGYQPLTMAIETTCARCGDALSVGASAYLGLRDGAGPRVFICPSCLPKPKKERT